MIFEKYYFNGYANNNRYLNNSKNYWDENKNPRVKNIILIEDINKILLSLINDNIIVMPDSTNINNVILELSSIYYNMVSNRRLWVYPDANWTFENIAITFINSYIYVLTDVVNNLLIKYYPYNIDNFKVNIDDINITSKKHLYNDYSNSLNNKIERGISNTNGSDKTETIDTDNSNIVNDVYLSPQDTGVKPTTQSSNIMNRNNPPQSSKNMGVPEVSPNVNNSFTTSTNVETLGSTNTSSNISNIENVSVNNIVNNDVKNDVNLGVKTDSDTNYNNNNSIDLTNILTRLFNNNKDMILNSIDEYMKPYYLKHRICKLYDFKGREIFD